MTSTDEKTVDELRDVVREFLADKAVIAADRAAFEAKLDALPPLWSDLAALGVLGIHLPAQYGGGEGEWSHLVVVLEELGVKVAPGPFLSSVVVADVLARRAPTAARERWLPGLADGSLVGGLGMAGALSRDGNRLAGDAGVVVSAGTADVLLLRCGDDLVVVDARGSGVRVVPAPGSDPGLHVGQVDLEGVAADADHLLPGGAWLAEALFRVACSAHAAGGARACLDGGVEYARVRHQFGRPIGSFQAVKHLCADMMIEAEVAGATVWDAARQAGGGEDEIALAAAYAAATAVPAFLHNARAAIQIYGGIGYTWEHDAHLYYRRAIALAALSSPQAAARDVARSWTPAKSHVRIPRLPESVETRRGEVRAHLAAVAARPEGERRKALAETGLAMPELPRPWGIEAAPALQLLLREEFAHAGVEVPVYGITGWVVASLIRYGTPEQVERWVGPAMAGEQIWCQLFSEPEAGSDAAGIRARGRRVEGGWVVSGQKVWTTLAHRSAFGLATIRTDPDASKHAGISAMVIDMNAPGVTVRPLRQITGASHFNEVWLDDVFVPDADVVGGLGQGWAVARTTFGNERLSIGRGHTADEPVENELVRLLQGAAGDDSIRERAGRLLARAHAARMINLRWAERALTVAPPGPEGNVTKMLRAESLQELAEIELALLGPQVAAAVPGTPGAMASFRWLDSPRASIAGGTSEIVRSQIAERLLGLPRERFR
jgi:3-oxochol-4-en-24-oyl-CoA dehydrogenase